MPCSMAARPATSDATWAAKGDDLREPWKPWPPDDAQDRDLPWRSVIEMIEAGKPCLDIAPQLQAVEKAVINAKRALIHDHSDHCLDAEHSAHDRDEMKAISRYL